MADTKTDIVTTINVATEIIKLFTNNFELLQTAIASLEGVRKDVGVLEASLRTNDDNVRYVLDTNLQNIRELDDEIKDKLTSSAWSVLIDVIHGQRPDEFTALTGQSRAIFNLATLTKEETEAHPYIQRLRKARLAITGIGGSGTVPVFITSLQNNQTCEATGYVASHRIAEETHRLSTDEEIQKFREDQKKREEWCCRETLKKNPSFQNDIKKSIIAALQERDKEQAERKGESKCSTQ